MENVRKRQIGRPPNENKKIHPPRIVIREKTILKIRELALKKGISQSEIYQKALDHYLENFEN